ncbi:Superkiller protein 3 [Coemansia sp. RSA 552]|nr:Superkiller protein 3 [Coemansia sp. RSA 552]
MSVIFKGKLKAAKAAIAEKNYDYAYDLCHDLLEIDEGNYNVHILLGVSCQHLDKWTEGEKVYRKAMGMPKANTLAWQGICALYEASKDTAKYEAALTDLRGRYMDEGNAAKAWETTHKLLTLIEESGDKRRLIGALRSLSTPGPLRALLDVTGADPSPPTLSDLLERMYAIESLLDKSTVDAEIGKRKTRIGAGPLVKVRQEVREEVFGQSGLLDTLAQLASLYEQSGDADKALSFKERLFDALADRLDVFGSPQRKSEAVVQLKHVAGDLVANGRSAGAFELLLELSDCGSKDSSDGVGDGAIGGLVDKYRQAFPNARLGMAAQAWEAVETGDVPSDLADVAREGVRKAPDSPFACVQLVRAAIAGRSYRLAVDSAIAARRVLQAFEGRFGVPLEQSQLIIDMSAADAYMKIGAEHASDAEHLYRKCLEADPGNVAATLGLGLATCALGSFAEGQQILCGLLAGDPTNHLALGGLGYAQMKEGDLQSAAATLQKAIDVEPGYAPHHISLGSVYWQMGGTWQQDKQYAYTSWIRAARLDASASEIFSGLGKWYQRHGGDPERAKKCYTKAVDLDCTDAEAGQALAALYLAEGSDDLCEDLLVRVTDASYAQRWAWKRLGFLRLRQSDSEQAVVAFQNALSADRTDCECWEGLCDAYMGIGRIHTSVKVAQKVVELDPSRVSGYWLCARACLISRNPEKALEYYDQATERISGAMSDEGDASDCDQQRVLWTQPLATGRAECLVVCAEKWHMEGMFGRTADASNQALAIALSLIAAGNEPSYLRWGIVHAACTWLLRVSPLFASHPDLVSAHTVRSLLDRAQEAEDRLDVPQYLDETVARAIAETRTCSLYAGHIQRLFELAERSARLRILGAPSAALASAAWTDLGFAYHDHSARLGSAPLLPNAGEDTSEPSQPLLSAAAGCALAAIQLDGTGSRPYILQGVVAAQANQAALAQHAFIVASRRAPLSGMPWTNLGFLYLQHGDIELANKAFSRAQMVDPEFVPGWLGQAIIAETLGSGECTELFEACLLLEGVTNVSDFCYARQVWRSAVARNISPETATPERPSVPDKAAPGRKALSYSEKSRLALAIFAARRYVSCNEDESGAGHHLLGMLLEHNKEYESAAEAYAIALERAVASASGGSDREWIALTCLGRAHCSAAQYDEAVATYTRADALLADGNLGNQLGTSQLFYYTLGFSLALFFAGQLEESLGRFEQALAQCENVPDQRPFVAVMLAQVLWALGTEEHRALARQHLVEAMSHHSGFVPGLATLFAIGLLQDDGDLVAAAYTELKQAPKDDPEHTVAKLESYLAVLQGDQTGGRRALARALHRDPSDASLWLLLADFEALSQRPADAVAAAEAALQLFRQAVRGHHSWSTAPSQTLLNSSTLRVVVAASAVESQARASSGDLSGSRAAGRRAVMYQPWSSDAWACLAT